MPICLCVLFPYDLRQLYVCGLHFLACTLPTGLLEEQAVHVQQMGVICLSSASGCFPLRNSPLLSERQGSYMQNEGLGLESPYRIQLSFLIPLLCVPEQHQVKNKHAPGSTWQQGEVTVPRLCPPGHKL